MSVKKFTHASILTAIIVVIEILAATMGEALVVLTILSSLPIYIICRSSIALGIASYINVGLILLLINPHQLLFFIFTNGLLGISLGFFDKKIKLSIISILASSLMLCIGIITMINLIGIFIVKWYIGILIFLFSCIYVSFYHFIARKIFERLNNIEKNIKW